METPVFDFAGHKKKVQEQEQKEQEQKEQKEQKPEWEKILEEYWFMMGN